MTERSNVVRLRPDEPQQPELGCASCARLHDLWRESERNAADAIEEMRQENLGLSDTVSALSKRNASLRGELTKARKAKPNAETVTQIMEAWRFLTGHKNAQIPLDGKRAKATFKMLEVYEADDLLEAVHGLALFPFDVGYGRRSQTGTRAQLRDDLEYLFASESRVEQFRELAQRAWLMRQANQRDLHEIVSQVGAVYDRWVTLELRTVGGREPTGLLELDRLVQREIEEFERSREGSERAEEAA